MVFIIIGLVIAAALVVTLVARNRESSSPLKTVESFKVGLEKISPEDERADRPAGKSRQEPFDTERNEDHQDPRRAEGA